MRAVSFESSETFSQSEFAEWLAGRDPSDSSRCELLNGRIVLTPPAGWPHGAVGVRLSTPIATWVEEQDLGIVFDASQGFELPSGDTVGPDVAFVSTARWEAAPEPEDDKMLPVVPDLVVEVLSRSTASRDRGEKKGIYERNAVREYWLVDPRARQVTRFVLRDGRFDGGTVFLEDADVVSEVLPGLRIPARRVLVPTE